MRSAVAIALLSVACIGCNFPLLNPNREGFPPWEKLPDGHGITYIEMYTHDPGIDPLYLASFHYADDAALQLVVDTFGLAPLPDGTEVSTFTTTIPDPIDWFPLKNVTSIYVHPDSNSYPGGKREYVANLWVDSSENIAIIERTWW
ncbi:MAG TPA: hypothetical protein VMM76_05790 [Pirellulaceae bacterium]|nr:hypothetical protein [Pirellulaceae bacterium]